MDFSYSFNTLRYAGIAEAMGMDISQKKEEEAARTAVDLVAKLIYDLDIPSLAKLGIERDKLKEFAPSMAQAAIDSGSPANNPRIATIEEIIDL